MINEMSPEMRFGGFLYITWNGAMPYTLYVIALFNLLRCYFLCQSLKQSDGF